MQSINLPKYLTNTLPISVVSENILNFPVNRFPSRHIKISPKSSYMASINLLKLSYKMSSSDFTESNQFTELEDKFAFLRHARESLAGHPPGSLDGSLYTVIDIETTGLDPVQNEIIEIAAIKVKDNDIKDIYNTLIQPSVAIPPMIEKLTGISDSLVAGYPSAKEALEKLLPFIESSILIAHNVEFDIPFIKYWTRMKLNHEITNSTLCTLKLSRVLLPGLGSYKLVSVAKYFKIPVSLTHRALADTEITYQVWLHLKELLKKRNIFTVNDALKLI